MHPGDCCYALMPSGGCSGYYTLTNSKLVMGMLSASSSFTTIVRPTATAKERRVRFQQETKSQSLDTPYHHTHEQHKLDMDMDSDTMAARSNSFTAISQCHTTAEPKGNLTYRLSTSLFY